MTVYVDAAFLPYGRMLMWLQKAGTSTSAKGSESPGVKFMSSSKLGVQWAENMDHEAVLFEYYKKMNHQKVHCCPDWDYMVIHEKSPEFATCTCEGLK